MRQPLRILLAASLVCSPLACKRTGDGTDGPGRADKSERQRPPPAMPRPYRLPTEPSAAVHLSAPGQTLQAVAAYVPNMPGPIGLLRTGAAQASMSFEGRMVAYLDMSRAFNGAVVEGQTIVQVPVARQHADTVRSQLASLPTEGDFGARVIPRQAGETGPKLVHFDDKNHLLTFADDLRGLATGYELGKAYGKHPLFLTVTAEEARKYGAQVPFSRLEVTGQGAHDFKAVAIGVPDDAIPVKEIAAGALTGLLETPQIALGASSRYADHDKWVSSTLSQAKRQVDAQNFLVRGVLEDLYRRGASVLRSWNGRTMVGTGPSGHVLVGLGADDPARAEKATLHLISGVQDNLATARSFGVGGLPKFRYKRNSSESGGSKIHMLVLERAAKFVPQEYRAVVDERGELRVAMAFPPRAGGVMVVMGADAENQMKRWLSETTKSTPASESRTDWVAATIAVGPEGLASIASDSTGAAALRLNPDTQPLKLVLSRNGDRLELRVTGDAQAMGKMASAARRTPPQSGSTPVARRTAPKRPVPTRTPTRTSGKRVR